MIYKHNIILLMLKPKVKYKIYTLIYTLIYNH